MNDHRIQIGKRERGKVKELSLSPSPSLSLSRLPSPYLSHLLILLIIAITVTAAVSQTVTANSNFSISAINNKSIQIKTMDNLTVIDTLKNNIPGGNLTYQNIIIEIKTNTSSLNINSIFSSMSDVQKDFTYIVVFMAVFGSLFAGIILMKKISGRSK